MVEQLRRRFILSAMLAILLVLVIIVGAIYGLNRYRMERNTDTLLEFMITQGELFPYAQGGDPGGMGREEWHELPIDAENDDDPDGDDDIDDDYVEEYRQERPMGEHFEGVFNGLRIDAETPYRTRYFSVYYSADGSYLRSGLGSIASVSESSAQEYGARALSEGKDRGKIDDFKYQKIITSSGETGYYFLDISEEKDNLRSNLLSSLIVAAASYLALFVLIYVISGKAVKPYADNMERQKQFITDAGHEIKTPLAIISANTEAIEMISGKSEWTDNIHSQIRRMNDLVQRLLVLARMEETGMQMQFSEFSLSEAVAEIAEPFITLAENQGKNFSMDIAPDILFNGDERGIREMVSIFCDNAVKYCDPEGKIAVRLQENGKKKVLSVSNTCAGAETAKVENWFSRFYREDTSRARTTGGFGIGLSIAKAVVDAHKGKVKAEYRNGDVILSAEF